MVLLATDSRKSGSAFSRSFDSFFRSIAEDIFKFCAALNFTPTRQQAAVLGAVQKAASGQGCPRIAVKSGQGVGKSTVSAVIGLWFCLRRYKAQTIVTAPSMKQCHEVWLKEARKLLENADPVLKKMLVVTATRVIIAENRDWGVVPITATRVENAQGLHADDMMVIIEEASGITREMFVQFLGTLSNQNPLMVAIGNPNSRSCFFFDCFNSLRGHWECFTFNAEEVAAEYPWLVDPGRNKLLEEMFGRDSDEYRRRVLGEFPFNDPNAVISSEDLEPCMASEMLRKTAQMPRAASHGGGLARQIGIDVARFGGDENTIFRRSGNAIVEWTHLAHTDPADAVDLAFRWQRDAGWRDQDCQYVIDASGMGQGVLHKFHRLGKRVAEFHNHGKAIDSQYENKITEAWFHAADLIKSKSCYIPRDNMLVSQLCNRLYFTTNKGKLVLESKDQYMKRIGADSPDDSGSPDRADGLVLSLYDAVQVAGNMAFSGKGKIAGVPYKMR